MNILIAGGTGLVGTSLTKLLLEKGHQISYLSRTKKNIPQLKVYQWDIKAGNIEEGAIETADVIINLAGAGVTDKSWTPAYKRELYDSRILATRLLVTALKERKHTVKLVIQASAIGIYGLNTGDAWLHETSPKGTDFLARLTADWEHEAMLVAQPTIRSVVFRIGVVLSKEGGAFKKLTLPIKLFSGAAIGTGKQYLSWVHSDDLCAMFLMAIENQKITGIYNAIAPTPVTNAELTKILAKELHRPLFLPNVPAFVLKMGMGEMADIVLGGNRVAATKLLTDGFQFKFPSAEIAVKELVKKK